MKRVLKKILNCISALFKFLYRLFVGIPYSIKHASIACMYKDAKRNCWITRFNSFYWRYLLTKNFGEFYYLYGLDSVNKGKAKEYLTESEFWKTSDKMNGLICNNHNACNCSSRLYLLRNKLDYYFYCKKFGIPTPEVYGFYLDGVFYDVEFKRNDELIKKINDFFIKDANGQCGSFVKHILKYEDLEKYKSTIANGLFIVQEKVTQTNFMSSFYPNSINTIRMVTIYNNGNPIVFSSVLRIGTHISGNVDNYSVGGICVGIDDNGALCDFGIFKPEFGLITKNHPDTNVNFKMKKIENYQLIKSKAIEAHKKFFGIYSIGWDIALTDNGPVFIEGNDNWEISLMQGCNGPLKKSWFSFLNKEN